MKKADLERYEQLLLEKQRELAVAAGEPRAPLPAAGDPQGDVIDQANADAEAELQIRLHQSDGRLLRAIEEALARIKKGTYGVCASCGGPISSARLNAVPWTRLCLGCKEKQGS